jgi:hypothetical protein
MLKRELDITRIHEPIGPRVSSALKPPTPLFQNLTMKCYFVDSFSLVLRLRPQFLVVFGAVATLALCQWSAIISGSVKSDVRQSSAVATHSLIRMGRLLKTKSEGLSNSVQFTRRRGY